MSIRMIGTAAFALLGAIVLYSLLPDPNGPPEGFARANGRVEAERVDVAAKLGGRLTEITVKEGDFVTKGARLAQLDPAEIKAQIREADAAVGEARERISYAKALKKQRESELALARQELRRAESLRTRGVSSQETVDRRRSAVTVAEAAVAAATADVGRSEAAAAAAIARVDRLKTTLTDHDLTAPKDGRVQYKLASVGEVLAAGGRVLTLLDLTDVYMTVFLPTDQAGRLRIGDEARIILDAAPKYVIPATVTFVASEAQFTPKYVETAKERAKLMFRVKVRIAPDLLRRYRQVVKTGLPGVAYLRVDPAAKWPEELAPRLPDAPAKP
ncbi:MAG: HlyD family efflux transporter periplasmic adaptor subunit [Neomegalonema sp.]|nr:HlyD family efflux transporter periplasmic adaptor subunit [Neomegalonema sp.]